MRCRNCGTLYPTPVEKCSQCGARFLTPKNDPYDIIPTLKRGARDRTMSDLVDYINNAKRNGSPLVLTKNERARAERYQDDLRKDFNRAMRRLVDGDYD